MRNEERVRLQGEISDIALQQGKTRPMKLLISLSVCLSVCLSVSLSTPPPSYAEMEEMLR